MTKLRHGTISKRTVEAIKVEKDTVFWDRELTGFGVRVQRNGRKVYVVQTRGPAGLKRVTLGPFAGVSIDKRRREAATIIDRIKRGLDPVPPEPEPEPTVADLAARCMRAYMKVHCKPKTEELYRTAIHRHIVPALGTMPVKDVRSKHVIETPSAACATHLPWPTMSSRCCRRCSRWPRPGSLCPTAAIPARR